MAGNKTTNFGLHLYNRPENVNRKVKDWIDEINGLNTETSNTQIIDRVLGEINGKVGGNTESIDALRTDVNKNIGDIDTLRTDVNKSIGDIDTLRIDVNQSIDDINTLRTDVNQSIDDINTLRTDVNQSIDDINVLRVDINKNSDDIGNIIELETENKDNLIGAINEVNKCTSSRIYKCTGIDDNVAICQIIENFLNTDDGIMNLKIYIEGVAGVNNAVLGDGSSENPYKVFYVDNENPYGKKVVLDGANCTFPLLDYSMTGGAQAHYFSMRNVWLENISIEIECISNSTMYGYAFYNCSNLTNCTGAGNGKGSGMGHGYGFYNCSNLTNCMGTGNGDASSIGTCFGYGFYNCTNLINCTGTGNSINYGYGFGFYSCSNLTNCTGTGAGRGHGHGYGFSNCYNLTNCIGTGTCTGTDVGQGYHNCSNLTNCTGVGIGVSLATGYGFNNCKCLKSCKGCGYASETSAKPGVGFRYYGSNIAQMINCIAPIEIKEGYKQTHGILLEGDEDGGKYCLVGNTVAPDSDSYVGIKKHTKTGDEYIEIGTIRAE